MKSQKKKDTKIWFAMLFLLADLTSIASITFLLGIILMSLRAPILRSSSGLIVSCFLYYISAKGLGIVAYVDIIKRLIRSLTIAVVILSSVVVTELCTGRNIDSISIVVLISGVAIVIANIFSVRFHKEKKPRSKKHLTTSVDADAQK